jgi:hypothetical protein
LAPDWHPSTDSTESGSFGHTPEWQPAAALEIVAEIADTPHIPKELDCFAPEQNKVT